MIFQRGLWLAATIFAAGAANLAHAQGPQPLPEVAGPTTGYSSVGEALAALRTRPGVQISEQGGWLIASDPAGPTVWSFPPKGHPAYPSAVKRQIENRSDGAYVNMSVQCEASKEACDELVRSFQVLNQQMAASLKGR